MKITKHLLARNEIYLLAALFWTFVIASLCLISFKELPKVDVKSADKYVHSIFHFVFTLLWFLYFKNRYGGKWLLKVFFLSLTFGALIEGFQALFTETRKADIQDVVANCTGSLLAILFIFLFEKLIKKKHFLY